MDILKLFFLPTGIISDYPALGLVPTLLFAVAGFCYRRRGFGMVLLIVFAAIAWGCFTAYSFRMREWEKTVVAPIRIDLLLLAPVLYIVTLAGVVQALFCWWYRDKPGSGN